MKRFRIGDEEIEVDVNLAHVLMSISHSHSGLSYSYNRNTNSYWYGNTGTNSSGGGGSCDGFKILEHPVATHVQTSSLSNRMFECKTCNRQFPSFQALGGHRASHKRPKLTPGHCSEVRIEPTKPRVHSCPICGLKFTIGQALGGHMRRHRAISDGVLEQKVEQQDQNTTSTLCLDLNLAPPGTTSQWRNVSSPIRTPSIVHQVSSMVDCFL